MFVRAAVVSIGVVCLAVPAFGAVSPEDTRPLKRAEMEIDRTEKQHRAWLRLDLDAARTQASRVQQSATDSPLRTLNGLVVAVKDNIDTDWLATTAGAVALRDRRPPRNATVVDRVIAAGGVIPGKTNMDTFARGVRTVSQLGGQTRNAIDPAKSPGGSSGGTAVAVALKHADVGVGTDTCGSLRYPAAYNGIYGLRPTPGLVSRSGILPLSPTHDVVGPMARTPRDLALLLDVMAGPDDRDPLTLTAPPHASYVAGLSAAPRSARLGVLRDRGTFRADTSGRTALSLLRAAGFELVEVKPPSLTLPNVINEEFAVLKPQILNGTLNESDWLGGMRIRTRAYDMKTAQLRSDRLTLLKFMDANALDALVYPTTPFPPASIGAAQPSANCSLSASTGTPALALPHGAPSPGVDVLGRPFSEDLLLEVAERFSVVKAREQ